MKKTSLVALGVGVLCILLPAGCGKQKSNDSDLVSIAKLAAIPPLEQVATTVDVRFEESVPNEIRDLFRRFLQAQKDRDGQGAYACLSTALEKNHCVEAFSQAAVPIVDPAVRAVSGGGYEIVFRAAPPGAVVGAVLLGRERAEAARALLDELRGYSNLVSQTEIWKVVDKEGGPHIDFGDRGVVRFALVVGSDMAFHEKPPKEMDELRQRLGGEGADVQEAVLKLRMAMLLAGYIVAYPEEDGHEARNEEMMAQVGRYLEDAWRVVVGPGYFLRVPPGWAPAESPPPGPQSSVMAYGMPGAEHPQLLTVQTDLSLRDYRQQAIRSTQAEHPGRLDDEMLGVMWDVEKGILLEEAYQKKYASRILSKELHHVGRDAMYCYVEKQEAPNGQALKVLRCKTLKGGVSYSLAAACLDEDFEGNLPTFTRIRDSFTFCD